MKKEQRIVLRKGKRNAMLCPECHVVIDCDFVNELGRVRLMCGHVRSAILPSKGVSFENIIAANPIAFRLFPAQGMPKRDLADVIEDMPQSERDKWQ